MTKTTFILAGGNDRASHDYGKRLGADIAKYVDTPKILSCLFASPKDVWEEKAHNWEQWFKAQFAQDFTYEYARPETFLAQMDAADVIYFHGGDTKLLLSSLPPTIELKEHFKGKIIIGSSAGANMLAKHFWSSKRAVMGEGLGIIDRNIMVHYGAADMDGLKRTPEDWEREKAEFRNIINNEEVVELPESKFIMIEQDL